MATDGEQVTLGLIYNYQESKRASAPELARLGMPVEDIARELAGLGVLGGELKEEVSAILTRLYGKGLIEGRRRSINGPLGYHSFALTPSGQRVANATREG